MKSVAKWYRFTATRSELLVDHVGLGCVSESNVDIRITVSVRIACKKPAQRQHYSPNYHGRTRVTLFAGVLN